MLWERLLGMHIKSRNRIIRCRSTNVLFDQKRERREEERAGTKMSEPVGGG